MVRLQGRCVCLICGARTGRSTAHRFHARRRVALVIGVYGLSRVVVVAPCFSRGCVADSLCLSCARASHVALRSVLFWQHSLRSGYAVGVLLRGCGRLGLSAVSLGRVVDVTFRQGCVCVASEMRGTMPFDGVCNLASTPNTKIIHPQPICIAQEGARLKPTHSREPATPQATRRRRAARPAPT